MRWTEEIGDKSTRKMRQNTKTNSSYRFLLNSHRTQGDFTAAELLRVHFN